VHINIIDIWTSTLVTYYTFRLTCTIFTKF